MKNIDEIILRINKTVKNHHLEQDGEYCRYLWQDNSNSRKMGKNEYGCADAVNLLYTIGEFPTDLKSRENHVKALQSMQEPETGLFREDTHHVIHTTAHCTAALELFDARPLYKFTALEQYKTVDGLIQLLEGLDWANQPWRDSHQGAGIYAALKLNDESSEEWEKAYFNWLWENEDSEKGFWKAGMVGNGTASMSHYMGGGFHYMFNMQYARMPLRYPEKVIDTCLDLYYDKQMGPRFGQQTEFIEVDWIYAITRSLRQSGYRREDCMVALRKFASEYLDWLFDMDYKSHDGFNDLHRLFGASCALAELQSALPGEIYTRKPLRLVLDRRPFI